MAAPTSYTEATLAAYMHAVLGKVAEALGYSAENSYAEQVSEALLAYGAEDIAEVSGVDNIKKLRALARVQAWQKVVSDTAGDHDFSADGGSYSRSQVHDMAKQNLQAAQTDAMRYDADYRVGVQRVRHTHDPYAVVDDELRTLP